MTKATSGTYSAGRSSLDIHNDYGTNYTYDARGNMMTLARSGLYNNGTTWLGQTIDDLDYDYYPNSNQIKTITDAASCPDNNVIQHTVSRSGTYSVDNLLIGKSKVFGDATVNYHAGNKIELETGFSVSAENGGKFTVEALPCPANYYETDGFVQRSTADLEYDENGNLKLDPHKKMQFEYNYLNLPTSATSTDDNGQKIIEWLYDANGTKLQKIVKQGSTTLSTQDYIDGVEYRDNTLEAIYTAEGRLYFVDGVGRYEYTLADHLGNNRVTFSDINGNGVIEEGTELLQENHYYPFGMAMKGDFSANVGKENKYLYNGKELDTDFGLNWYHYGARMYDPAIGRFTGVDPISDQFAWVSTYNYAENEPIANIDLHGLQKLRFTELVQKGFEALGLDGNTVRNGQPNQETASFNSKSRKFVEELPKPNPEKVEQLAEGLDRYGASLEETGDEAVVAGGAASVTGVGTVPGAVAMEAGAIVSTTGALMQGGAELLRGDVEGALERIVIETVPGIVSKPFKSVANDRNLKNLNKATTNEQKKNAARESSFLEGTINIGEYLYEKAIEFFISSDDNN